MQVKGLSIINFNSLIFKTIKKLPKWATGYFNIEKLNLIFAIQIF